MNDDATPSSARTISKKRSSCIVEFIAPFAHANLKTRAKQCVSTSFAPRERLRSRKNNNGPRSKRSKCTSLVFSVQPLCSLCLCGYGNARYNNHRDTENTEVAQRSSSPRGHNR